MIGIWAGSLSGIRHLDNRPGKRLSMGQVEAILSRTMIPGSGRGVEGLAR